MRVLSCISLGLLAACPKSTPEPPPPPVPAKEAPAPEAPTGPTILLDGAVVEAWWDDGDTFSIANPDGGKRIRARLDGFNTLESYGPVHRWGDWTALELYGLAKDSGERARSEQWTCMTQEGTGGYGRIRVDCPDLRAALLSEGLAMVFAIDEPPRDEDLVAMKAAVEAKVGMWAQGAPEGLITSLHSLDEKEDQENTYHRILSLETGMADKHVHSDTHTACEEVCLEGSCMTYVPYKQRYGHAVAECIRVD
jgi:endonuclease YncB( thermonuclease family)